MHSRRAGRTGVVMLTSVFVLALTAKTGVADRLPPFEADDIASAGRVDASKAPTSRLAETDPVLLGRTDASLVPVVVKLDYDSVATYQGTVAGIEATSPSVTGHELSGDSVAELEYANFVADQEAAFAFDLADVGAGRDDGYVAAHRVRRRHGGRAGQPDR